MSLLEQVSLLHTIQTYVQNIQTYHKTEILDHHVGIFTLPTLEGRREG
jgi:hypothetical protein